MPREHTMNQLYQALLIILVVLAILIALRYLAII